MSWGQIFFVAVVLFIAVCHWGVPAHNLRTAEKKSDVEIRTETKKTFFGFGREKNVSIHCGFVQELVDAVNEDRAMSEDAWWSFCKQIEKIDPCAQARKQKEEEEKKKQEQSKQEKKSDRTQANQQKKQVQSKPKEATKQDIKNIKAIEAAHKKNKQQQQQQQQSEAPATGLQPSTPEQQEEDRAAIEKARKQYYDQTLQELSENGTLLE